MAIKRYNNTQFIQPIAVEKIDFTKVSYVTVDIEHAGQRIDNFLIKHLKGVPRSHLYRFIRKGEVRINERRARASSRIYEGDNLRIAPIRISQRPRKIQPSAQKKDHLNDQILYEDDEILVIDKPSGIAVHGGSGVAHGVIETIRATHQNQKYIELVHRLDRDTSGCLIMAKKRSVLTKLQKDMFYNKIKKSYCALVKGLWPKTTKMVSAPLLKNHLSSGERIVRVDSRGKESITRVSLVNYFSECSLLDIQLVTGRTHQIRVHCQFVGHPIAGDLKYGDKNFNTKLKVNGLKRLFLHANQLNFKHPRSGKHLKITAKLPKPLENLLESI